jgi:hypothetical protein
MSGAKATPATTGGGGKWSQFAQETKALKEKRKLTIKVEPNAHPQPTTNAVAAAPTNARSNPTPPPSRFIKKAAPPPPVVPMDILDFHWSEVVYGHKRGGTQGYPPMIPLRNPTQGPMCITWKGGGTIPQSIGLQRTDNGKLRLTLQVDSVEERKACGRIYEELIASAMVHAKEWYPDTDIANYNDSVGRILSEVKAKPDGTGEYPPLASVNIDERDLVPKDLEHEPALVIMKDGGQKQEFDVLAVLGQRWEYMVWELQWLIIGVHKEKGYPYITLSRRLRRLHIAVDENSFHTVFPEDKERHDATECKRKHTTPQKLLEFSLKKDATIMPLVMKEKSASARVESKTGGDVILVLKGGGTLPFFVIDQNQQGDINFSFSVDSIEEEQKLDAIVDELRTHVVKERATYYPKSEMPDEFLKYTVKRLLGKKSDKPEHADFTRNMSCIIDTEKIGTTVSIIGGLGQAIMEPSRDALVGKRWEEAWIVLRSVYRQVEGDLFKVGFSKRLLYIKLAREMSDYTLSVAPPPAADATATADVSKRQRTA